MVFLSLTHSYQEIYLTRVYTDIKELYSSLIASQLHGSPVSDPQLLNPYKEVLGPLDLGVDYRPTGLLTF